MSKYECGVCRERNSLENTRCTRCGQILPWGFLHDPSLIVPEIVEVPVWARWLDTIFNPNNEPPKCRYCGEGIAAEALVRPHCQRILRVRTEESFGTRIGPTIPESAELQALIERFLSTYPYCY